MISTLKRFVPAPLRRTLRPLTLAYQQRTQKQNALTLFGNFIAPGDLVFDIGANTGRLTDIFLSLGAKVVAVEPQPLCAGNLHARYVHNKRCTVIERGVAATPGVMDMNICGDIDEISSFRPDWENRHYAARFTNKIPVTMTTLDALIRLKGMPDFCKVDVEGYEPEVFKGLTRPIPNLCFEYHRHAWDELEACFAELKRLGLYRFNFVPHEVQRLQLHDWRTAGEMMAWLGHRQVISGDIFARLH